MNLTEEATDEHRCILLLYSEKMHVIVLHVTAPAAALLYILSCLSLLINQLVKQFS